MSVYMYLLLITVVFATLFFLILGVYSLVQYKKNRFNLVKKFKEREQRALSDNTHKKTFTILSRLKNGFLQLSGSLGILTRPKNTHELSNLRLRLIRAGYRRQNASTIFMGAKIILASFLLVMFLFANLVPPMNELNFLQTFFLALGLALIGFYMPNYWLRFKIAQRQKKITEVFPDALDLLVVCVEAGLGLDSAITWVGKEMEQSKSFLSEELQLVNLELRAGKVRREALRNLALRTDLEDVNNLVTVLIQTDKFGTSIARALRVHSDFMRKKRHQRAEEIASKLQVKLLFPLIFFIFPALFIVILGPAVIQIFKVFIG